VKALVEYAGIKRSTYYVLVKKIGRPDPDTGLKAEIQAIYDEHEGRYGYRRIRDELQNRGQKVNHKRVQRLMKALGLKCLVRLKKYKSYRGAVGEIADNILDRDFKADAPNEKWVTDISEFKLFGVPCPRPVQRRDHHLHHRLKTDVFTGLRDVGERPVQIA